MQVLKNIWTFLRKYWYIPLAFIAAVAAWLIFRKKAATPVQQTKTEIAVIQAGEKAAEDAATLGVDKARAVVEYVYNETIQRLNDEQVQKTKELANDPAALAKYLVRVAGSNPPPAEQHTVE